MEKRQETKNTYQDRQETMDPRKYLEKFGWNGGGLGKKQDGMKSYIKVTKKDDSHGVCIEL